MELAEVVRKAVAAKAVTAAQGDNLLIEVKTLQDIGELSDKDSTLQALLHAHVRPRGPPFKL